MSHRPLEGKKLRRLRKALRQKPDTVINLVEYLKLRGYAQTTGEAKRIILDRRVRSESHTLGIQQGIVTGKNEQGKLEFKVGDVVAPLIPSHFKDTLVVYDEPLAKD